MREREEREREREREREKERKEGEGTGGKGLIKKTNKQNPPKKLKQNSDADPQVRAPQIIETEEGLPPPFPIYKTIVIL